MTMAGVCTESVAVSIYRLARASLERPADPEMLARRVFGAGIVREPLCVPVPAYVIRTNGRWEVRMRPDLGPVDERFYLAHEVAEMAVRGDRWIPDIEAACNRIAAALLMPGAALRKMATASLAEQCEAFRVSPTGIVLRWAELERASLAVVSPERVRTRGAYPWPSPALLRRLAFSRHDPAPLRRANIPGDPSRVVLYAS